MVVPRYSGPELGTPIDTPVTQIVWDCERFKTTFETGFLELDAAAFAL
jgi:hypothetical protein